MKNILLLLSLAFFFFACSSSSDDEVKPDATSEEYKAAEAYFNSTLKPVITANCTSCHEGYHSMDNSSSYGILKNAINNASGMFNQVNTGTMPKGGAKLPQESIDKFSSFKELVNKIP